MRNKYILIGGQSIPGCWKVMPKSMIVIVGRLVGDQLKLNRCISAYRLRRGRKGVPTEGERRIFGRLQTYCSHELQLEMNDWSDYGLLKRFDYCAVLSLSKYKATWIVKCSWWLISWDYKILIHWISPLKTKTRFEKCTKLLKQIVIKLIRPSRRSDELTEKSVEQVHRDEERQRRT